MPRMARPLFLALLLLTLSAHADPDATELSLEELLDVPVMSVSRKAQRLHDVAAAVFVISREDIQRSGAANIPDALRMVPGVQVAKLSNATWAVSARGFNGRFANKLQVLMDGRSIYSPLFSGVLWEREDTLLEDVERIEVIRGPGAAIWGANAVNGVINIITRRARDTQGTLLEAGIGTTDRGVGAFRYGAASGDGHYRIWGKLYDRGESVQPDGRRGNDFSHGARVGFRGDWPLASVGKLMLSGAAFSSAVGDRLNQVDIASAAGFTRVDARETNKGGHLLARREWLLGDGSEIALQSYIDHAELRYEGVAAERRTTIDVDFQHHTQLGRRHDVVWGLGYRYSSDDVTIANIQPQKDVFRLVSAFAHDEITLIGDTLRLTLGARVEHNSYTGLEPQPNVRLMWTPNAQQSLWTALSRAVRTPSRGERDIVFDLAASPAQPPLQPFPVLIRNVPRANRDAVAETLTAFEIGYRHQFASSVSLDITAFRNRYKQLLGGVSSIQRFEVLPAPPHVLQEVTTTNKVAARTSGIELAMDWIVEPWWRIQPSYGYLWVSSEADSADPFTVQSAAAYENRSPRHQLSLRSSMSLSNRNRLDLWLRHTGALKAVDSQGNRVPRYTTLDLRYAWEPSPGIEISLVGQNLFAGRHAQALADFLPSQAMLIEPGAYINAKWRF